jgi:hypothetical protein
MHAELAKVLNDMRKSNEPVDSGTKGRARAIYDVTISEGTEFREVLAAVPADENWQTYLWLSPDAPADVRRDFVHASLAEFSSVIAATA